MADRTIKVFISAPSDVRAERLLAARIVQKLAAEFATHFAVEAIMWERAPLVAHKTFQDGIPRASASDIVVVIMWSRLGSPLPDQYTGPVSGKHPVTGTEFEFEDGLASARATQRPHLLFYRKTDPPEQLVNLADGAAVLDRVAQNRAAEDFVTRWFSQQVPTGGTAAFHPFGGAPVFEETLETHLRAALRALIEGDARGENPRWHQGNPFRGLERFETAHAAIFFGRAGARAALRERLARRAQDGCAFVALVGGSGVGKSSLVLAGLLPDLMLPGMIGRVALCRVAVMRPSDRRADPVAALAHAVMTALPELRGLLYEAVSLASLLPSGAAQARLAIAQGLKMAGQAATPPLSDIGEARLVLVIDQLEELFTQDTATAAIDAFAGAVAALARSGLVWIVATLRSDFCEWLEAHPALAALCDGPARHLLLPPNQAEIGQIVCAPAREAGLRFESDPRSGAGLDDMLREAACRQPGALPLLEFTLDQLWHKRTPAGLLTLAAYAELGGLEGAIGKRADQVLEGLPQEVRDTLPAVLRAMVTVGQGEKGRIAAREAPLVQFPPGTPGRTLIDAFQSPQARLVVAEETGRRVRVAHEALLTHWPVAQALVAVERRDLQLRDRLEMDEARWFHAPPADQPSLLLPPGLPLSEAEDLALRRQNELEAPLRAFVDASRAAEAAARRQKQAAERREREEAQRAERDRLEGEATLQRMKAAAARRLTRVAGAASAMLLVLLAVAVGAALYARAQRDRAERIKLIAEHDATGLVVDLAHGLGERAGIPVDAIEKVLDHASAVIASITALAPDDVDARRLQATALDEFAETYLHEGDTGKALAAASHAADLLRALVAAHPEDGDLYADLAIAQRWVGNARQARGDTPGALDAYRAWLAITRELARLRPDDPEQRLSLARAERSVGDMQARQGDTTAALASYRESMAVLGKQEAARPHDSRVKLDLSISDERIGDVYETLGNEPASLDAYQASLALRQQLVVTDPGNATWQRDLSVAYGDVSDGLAASHRLPEAVTAYKAGMAISERLAARDPANLQWQYDVAIGHSNLGDLLMTQGDLPGAIASYQTGLVLTQALVGKDPANVEWSRGLVVLENNLGFALMQKGDPAAARPHAQRALDLARRLAHDNPDNAEAATDLQRAAALVHDLGVKR
jgi:tetratricopeptide (TPR) repeat protein